MATTRSLKFSSVILVLLSLVVSAAQGQKLTFSAFEGSPGQDMSELILREAYASMGMEIEVLRFPGLRSLDTANKGIVDGELGRVKAFEHDYPNLVPVPLPVSYLSGTAFSKIDGLKLNGWDSLRGYSIGITRGMKFAEQGTDGMPIVEANSHEQLFQLLDRGRIDVAINPLVNGLGIIEKLGFEGIHALEPPLVHIELYHFLHRRHAALIPEVAETIRKMEASGRIDEIQNQFFRDISKNYEISN